MSDIEFANQICNRFLFCWFKCVLPKIHIFLNLIVKKMKVLKTQTTRDIFK